jgi:hypothetical protein
MAELNSAKQEKFVQGLANGLSQRAAYRAAFPTSKNWKDTTVDVKACELAKDNKVLVRLKELQQLSTSSAIMTATQRKEWLTDLIKDEDEETKDRLKALDILNKMDGEYTEKVELNGNVNNPFEGLTTEELKKLIRDA